MGTIARAEVTVSGVTRTLREWADYYKLPYKTVAMRYRRGHRDPKLLFFKPSHTKDAQGNWVYKADIGDIK